MGSFTKREQIVILLVVFMIIILLGFRFIVKDFFSPKETEIGLVTNVQQDVNEGIDDIEEAVVEYDNPIILVHISGQVFNPGIYELVIGDRVNDAVKLAGGLKNDADLDQINLAKKVSDEEKIYIPKVGEEISEKIASNTSIAPNFQTKTVSKDNSGKTNINSCTSIELQALPGIGEVIANRIIEYRSSNSFKSIEELMNVSGIGEKKYEGIKDLIIVK